MKVLTTADLLADIEFVDYWDAKLLSNDSSLTLLEDIQFIDYWDAEFCLNDADPSASLDNWNDDILSEDWDADIPFRKNTRSHGDSAEKAH
jgi:hypothetical protein